jgi:fatty acid desaturase
MHSRNYPESYLSSEADARYFVAVSLSALGLLYLHFLLVLAAWLPYWSFLLAVPIYVVRWMLSVHELFHVRTAEQVDPITRLLPLVLSPFTLGYKEMLDIHRQHHRHTAEPEDSEYYQLRGPAWIGFLNALFVPEQAFVRWLLRKRLDADLLKGMVIRFALFALLVGISGAEFWAYFIPVRLSFGISNFSFFYCLHRQGGEYGTYPLPLPLWAERIFSFLFGEEAMLATCHHDVHHAHPRIAAHALAEARVHLN